MYNLRDAKTGNTLNLAPFPLKEYAVAWCELLHEENVRNKRELIVYQVVEDGVVIDTLDWRYK